MTRLTLATDMSLKSTPGNFNAVVDVQKQTLSFPPEIMSALSHARDWNAQDGKDALTVLGAMYSFPSAVSYYLAQDGLQWSPQEAFTAAESLAKNLVQNGHLDPQFLAPPPKRVYGAIPPRP